MVSKIRGPYLAQRLTTQPIPRYIRHGSTARFASTSTVSGKSDASQSIDQHPQAPSILSRKSALGALPLSAVLRSYFIMTMSSSPLLWKTSMNVLQRMLHSKSFIFDVDRNPLLRILFKQTFYAQFCAGENKAEVKRCMDNMHRIGYHGLILEFGREILDDGPVSRSKEDMERAIETWRVGLLDTIKMVDKGDFVGLKWSGMGSEALAALKASQPPSESMAKAITDLCDAAAAKEVKLLPAAEPQNAQASVDAWTLQFAQKYNTLPGHAVLYNTYQCYLKSTPATLARHLAFAEEKGFTLGVKLVRGAYLGTEQRNLIWDTKEETDNTYNSVAEAVLRRKYSNVLKAHNGQSERFPDISFVLATHNLESVQRARKVRDNQKAAGDELVTLAYAQLQGMADEVSCALVDAQTEANMNNNSSVDSPKIYKCVTWGNTSDCLHYLFRRAAENKDAMSRTRMTGQAMGQELRRRFKATFGLA